MLQAYGATLKIENPETIFEVELTNGVHFKYLFMALGKCIRRFVSCIRHVLTVDAMYLKGKYIGVMEKYDKKHILSHQKNPKYLLMKLSAWLISGPNDYAK